MRLKKIVMAIACASIVALTGMATPANAATGKNGILEVGEFGLYWLQFQGGPVFDLDISDSNFAGQYFPGTSILADNNTESYRSRDTLWWHVFTGSNYTGFHGCLPPAYIGNASATFKDTISSVYHDISC